MVSFVTVGIVWINHHVMMDGIAKLDRTLIELNLLLLMFVALIPRPTGLLALNLRGAESGAAAVTYGLVMTAMATSFFGIWAWIARAEKLCHPAFRPVLSLALRRALIGPIAYLTGTVMALASAPAAFGIYTVVAVYYAASRRQAGMSVPAASAGVTVE